jgi:hypothetical protein
VFVVEGRVKIGNRHLGARDYLYTPPQGVHAVWSESGCEMLVALPKPIEILTE